MLMGKLTISMAMFKSFLYVYQRISLVAKLMTTVLFFQRGGVEEVFPYPRTAEPKRRENVAGGTVGDAPNP